MYTDPIFSRSTIPTSTHSEEPRLGPLEDTPKGEKKVLSDRKMAVKIDGQEKCDALPGVD
jgi:hypothetical protein